jgi:hypothetical protein
LDRDRGTLSYKGAEISLKNVSRRSLTLWLYAHVHVGNPAAAAEGVAYFPDFHFEEVLRNETPDAGAELTLPRVEVSPRQDDVEFAELDGLRLSIPRMRVVATSDTEVTFIMSQNRPRLSPGFFLHGNEGARDLFEKAVRRFYGRASNAEAALPLWRDTIQALESAGVPFQAKVLSDRTQYPRNDALVVYCVADGALIEQAEAALASVETGHATAENGGSPLCRPIEGGWRAADSPPVEATRGPMSFGIHRSNALAAGLIRCLSLGGPLADHLRDAIALNGIDPEDVALNLVARTDPGSWP